MTKIAFDLDGVLLPDCDEIPSLGGLREFYNLTMYMRPLFIPTGPYEIITGRSPLYRQITIAWIQKYLTVQPTALHHSIGNHETPAEYKARTLESNAIDIYVESDIQIVYQLLERTDRTIIHFGSYIPNKLNILFDFW